MNSGTLKRNLKNNNNYFSSVWKLKKKRKRRQCKWRYGKPNEIPTKMLDITL